MMTFERAVALAKEARFHRAEMAGMKAVGLRPVYDGWAARRAERLLRNEARRILFERECGLSFNARQVLDYARYARDETFTASERATCLAHALDRARIIIAGADVEGSS